MQSGGWCPGADQWTAGGAGLGGNPSHDPPEGWGPPSPARSATIEAVYWKARKRAFHLMENISRRGRGPRTHMATRPHVQQQRHTLRSLFLLALHHKLERRNPKNNQRWSRAHRAIFFIIQYPSRFEFSVAAAFFIVSMIS